MKSHRILSAITSLLLCAAACRDDDGGDGASETGTTEASGTTDTGTDTDTVTGTTGGTATDTGETDSAGPACGDGVLDDGEQCDDGDTDDTDDCSNACIVHCGLEWEKVIDPVAPMNNGASARAAVVDDSGNVFLAGTMETPAPAVWLARYSPDGTEQWRVAVEEGVDGDASVNAIALDSAGGVYLAGAGQALMDGDMNAFVWRYGADGTAMWAVHHGVGMEPESADGVATAMDGSAIVVETIRNDAMDGDIVVRKLAAADGSETWETSHTGMVNPDNMYSLDAGGPVVVDDGGVAHVLATLYVDYNTRDAILLEVPADGGTPVAVVDPIGPAGDHIHIPRSIALSSNGERVVTFGQDPQGISVTYRISADAMTVDLIDPMMFAVGMEEPFVDGVRFDGDDNMLLSGNYQDPRTNVWTGWIARVAPDDTQLCLQRWDRAGDAKPTLFTHSNAVAPDGTPYVFGSVTASMTPGSAFLSRFRQ